MDWYYINSEGHLILVSEREGEEHVLFSENGSSVEVKDRSILPTLSGNSNFQNDDRSSPDQKMRRVLVKDENGILREKLISTYKKADGHAAVISSASEAKKVFEFAASNSDVEWGLKKYENGKWVVGTIHLHSLAPNFESLGEDFAFKKTVYNAHSHSGSDEYIHFTPSEEDRDVAGRLKEINPNAQSWLFRPKHPKQKWLKIK